MITTAAKSDLRQPCVIRVARIATFEWGDQIRRVGMLHRSERQASQRRSSAGSASDSPAKRLRPNWARSPCAMRIIARRTLREFVRVRSGHKDQPALKAALDAWFDEVRKARWSSTADVKRRYATASAVSADRIVFNISPIS